MTRKGPPTSKQSREEELMLIHRQIMEASASVSEALMRGKASRQALFDTVTSLRRVADRIERFAGG